MLYHTVDDELFRDFPLSELCRSKIYYYRLRFPDLCLDVDRFIYIDTDTIILSDLSDMYNTNLEGKVLGAVAEAWGEHRGCGGALDVGLSPGHFYFNSGVLLIDCKLYREKNIFERCGRVAKSVKQLFSIDQDLLNIVFDENQYYRLPPKYNYVAGWQTPFIDPCFIFSSENIKQGYKYSYDDNVIDEAFKNPAIIHMIKGSRPGDPHARLETCALWNKYASLTPYAEFGERNKLKSEVYDYINNEFSQLYFDKIEQKIMENIKYKIKTFIPRVIKKIFKKK